MKNVIIFSFLVFALTGLLAPSAISDAYSEKGGNDKAKGDPKGCDNGNGKDSEKNPNCNGTEPPTDPVQFTTCDTNPIDGNISSEELRTYFLEQGVDVPINFIILWIIESSTDGDDYVNNDRELRKINTTFDSNNLPPCI